MKPSNQLNTKELIITTALKLFKQKSYTDVSVKDICAACNLSKQAFYYHFTAKADILVECYNDEINSLLAAKPQSVTNYWQQFVHCITRMMQINTDMGVDLISHFLIANLMADRGYLNVIDSYKKMCVSYIQKAQELQQVRNQSNPDQLYTAAQILANGYTTYWAIKDGGFDTRTNLIASLEVMFDVPLEQRTAKNDIQV
ncbi:TetR/AcrR family transcriptional regulator [Lactobacillus sp. ESL0684]|uniref:TetR/AcrR family transcriptional regulator n=1 Tax=unclassified Lactobacillus TaxID=2620435 RepID=UPI0023F8C265|nr:MULTISPECIES: TetR/AcrR family transcriptional regulator [unclassified Lactobacillus]WEV40021.1 TetR/AcrR family transcriptional regulator [Lactobacillus sp. ESL0681]WEV43439.1 TetR/AcrR family transcriptional regulator [Lactobacillus sp. ESL0684]